jgi:hypothetical protein
METWSAWIALHPFGALFIWFTLGILAWGWANYCAYKDSPSADSNPKKWRALGAFVPLGPISVLVVLFVLLGDRKFYFGLRFK